MASRTILILRLLSIIFTTTAAKGRSGSLRIIYTKIECAPIFDPNIVEQFECSLIPQTGPGGELSPTLTLHLKLARDIENVIAPFNLTLERNGKRDRYLSIDLDVCKALGELHENFLFHLIYDFRRYSNLPLQCPLQKGVDYYINNFTFDSHLIPSYMPELLWESKTEFLVKGKKTLIFNAYGKVVRDKKTRKRSG